LYCQQANLTDGSDISLLSSGEGQHNSVSSWPSVDGDAQNARKENAALENAASKMQGWKMQDWKMRVWNTAIS